MIVEVNVVSHGYAPEPHAAALYSSQNIENELKKLNLPGGFTTRAVSECIIAEGNVFCHMRTVVVAYEIIERKL